MSEDSLHDFRWDCRSYREYLPAYSEEYGDNVIDLYKKTDGMKEKIREILYVFDCIPLPAMKFLIWMNYVQKVSVRELADRFNFSPDYLIKIIHAQAEKAVEIAAERSKKL